MMPLVTKTMLLCPFLFSLLMGCDDIDTALLSTFVVVVVKLLQLLLLSIHSRQWINRWPVRYSSVRNSMLNRHKSTSEMHEMLTTNKKAKHKR